MRCPRCNSPDRVVRELRPAGELLAVYRVCRICHLEERERFTTAGVEHLRRLLSTRRGKARDAVLARLREEASRHGLTGEVPELCQTIQSP